VKKELRHLKGLTRLGPVVCLTGPRRAERASGAQPHATVALTGCGDERRGSQSATKGGEQTQELACFLAYPSQAKNCAPLRELLHAGSRLRPRGERTNLAKSRVK